MNRTALLTIALLGLAGIFPGTVAAAPVVLLNDNFNGENGGVGALNYNGFSNFNVTSGSVDLIGQPAGFFDILPPGNGLYVDLDGTTNQAGTLTSNNLNLNVGTYTLSFDIAGNQRGFPADTLTVALGALFNEVFVLNSGDPLQTIVRNFPANSATIGALSFALAGGDNRGILLDNVSLVFDAAAAPVPEPATFLLWGLGTGGLCLYRRKRGGATAVANRPA